MSRTKLLHKESLKHTQQGFEIQSVYGMPPRKEHIYVIDTYSIPKTYFQLSTSPHVSSPKPEKQVTDGWPNPASPMYV